MVIFQNLTNTKESTIKLFLWQFVQLTFPAIGWTLTIFHQCYFHAFSQLKKNQCANFSAGANWSDMSILKYFYLLCNQKIIFSSWITEKFNVDIFYILKRSLNISLSLNAAVVEVCYWTIQKNLKLLHRSSVGIVNGSPVGTESELVHLVFL